MFHPLPLTSPGAQSAFASPASSGTTSPSRGSRSSSEGRSRCSIGSALDSERSASPSPMPSPRLWPRRGRTGFGSMGPLTQVSQNINGALMAYRPGHDAPVRLGHLMHLLRWDVLPHMQSETGAQDAAAQARADGDAAAASQPSFASMYETTHAQWRAISSGRAHLDDSVLSLDGYTWAHVAARFGTAPHALLPSLLAQGVDITLRTQEQDTVLHALMRNTRASPRVLERAASWVVGQGVDVSSQDVLGATAALVAALYSPSAAPLLALLDTLSPGVLRIKDRRGWSPADGLMANPKASVEALLFALFECGLSLDGQLACAWRADLRGLAQLKAGAEGLVELSPAQLDAAMHKPVQGPLAYEDDHAGAGG